MPHPNWADALLDDAPRPVLPRRKLVERSELDITPMIDITFLLLIYFLVCSMPDPNTAVELPEARFGKGVGQANSVVLTVTDGGLGAAPVYLADGRVEGSQLSADPEKQSDQIQAAVEEGLSQGKSDVIVKAERGVAYREVARVAAAVSRVRGIRLHVGVLETE
jgi:biopolymer transport protein ExbD